MEARTEDCIDGLLEDGLDAIFDEFGGLESDDDEALDVGAEGDNDRSGSGPSADSSGAIVAIDPNAAHSSSSGGGAASLCVIHHSLPRRAFFLTVPQGGARLTSRPTFLGQRRAGVNSSTPAKKGGR